MIKFNCKFYKTVGKYLVVLNNYYGLRFPSNVIVLDNNMCVRYKDTSDFTIVVGTMIGILGYDGEFVISSKDKILHTIPYNHNDIWNPKLQTYYRNNYLSIIPVDIITMLQYTDNYKFIIKYFLLQDIIINDIAQYIILLKLEHIRTDIDNYTII